MDAPSKTTKKGIFWTIGTVQTSFKMVRERCKMLLENNGIYVPTTPQKKEVPALNFFAIHFILSNPWTLSDVLLGGSWSHLVILAVRALAVVELQLCALPLHTYSRTVVKIIHLAQAHYFLPLRKWCSLVRLLPPPLHPQKVIAHLLLADLEANLQVHISKLHFQH